MQTRAVIHYRTADGSYKSLFHEVAATMIREEIVPWALQNLPSGSLLVLCRFETRPDYPEEAILKGII